jgi:thioredoxin-like negative regulator of GroEL
VDFDTEPKLFQRFGVAQLPSFKVFVDGKTRNPYTGVVSRIPQDFKAPATASGLAKALKALLPSEHISQIASQADWDAFRGQSDVSP